MTIEELEDRETKLSEQIDEIGGLIAEVEGLSLDDNEFGSDLTRAIDALEDIERELSWQLDDVETELKEAEAAEAVEA